MFIEDSLAEQSRIRNDLKWTRQDVQSLSLLRRLLTIFECRLPDESKLKGSGTLRYSQKLEDDLRPIRFCEVARFIYAAIFFQAKSSISNMSRNRQVIITHLHTFRQPSSSSTTTAFMKNNLKVYSRKLTFKPPTQVVRK